MRLPFAEYAKVGASLANNDQSSVALPFAPVAITVSRALVLEKIRFIFFSAFDLSRHNLSCGRFRWS